MMGLLGDRYAPIGWLEDIAERRIREADRCQEARPIAVQLTLLVHKWLFLQFESAVK